MSVEQYKDKINELRTSQKQKIKQINAQTSETTWTVNNSKVKGRKMVRDITRLLLRAFNNECDDIIRKIKFSNIDSSVEAIQKSAMIISKLGQQIHLSIPQDYINLKKEEAYVAFEYAHFKQMEKDRQRELRELEREERRVLKEIAEQRKKLNKERKQYENALSNLEDQIARADDSNIEALYNKKAEIIENLNEIVTATKDVDYREANQKAGYVYIISNIGSFGKNVYKIGMTHRLDPMDRISELGDASVPFKFDVHAMIFTEDAPGLELALHKEFEKRKLNKVNQRKEFFHVTLDEIKTVIQKNYDKTVEFIDIPDAEQYRISQK